MGRLDGRIALISGVGGGQGRAGALAFAREGAQVYGCDLDPDSPKETARLLAAEGLHLETAAPVDLSDPEQTQDWVRGIGEANGRIDVLYNNAGSAAGSAFIEDLDPASWRAGMRNMVDLVYFPTHYAWPYLVASGSSVVINTAAAGAGLRGFQDFPMLLGFTAKAAVAAMTRQLAAEGAAHGIRANVLSPGQIRIPAYEQYYSDPEIYARRTRLIPLGRPGTVEEIAAAAVFLASADSSYVTGADLVVDGGSSTIRTGERSLGA